MTLVVGLSIGALPAFMGDLLTSWQLPTAVDLPTRPQKAVHPVGNNLHAATLAQKLIIVRPYLMIAWAGVQSEAYRIIRELDACCPDRASDLKDPHLVLRILDSCKEGVEMVALLIYRDQINPICIRTTGFEIDDHRLYVLGSGTQDFISSLQEYAPVDLASESNDGLLARATLLRFAARAMVTQWVGGFGLDNAWGGGFEVVYPDREVGGFRKVDNVMFRAWKIELDGSYSTSGRSFFAHYYGNDLHLSWFSTDEKTHVVPSPLARAQPTIPKYEKIHPEWTLDFFLVSEVPIFVEFARYQPPNRPVVDWIEIKNGALVGWSMDKAYVDKCAKLAIANSRQGATFKMMGY